MPNRRQNSARKAVIFLFSPLLTQPMQPLRIPRLFAERLLTFRFYQVFGIFLTYGK